MKKFFSIITTSLILISGMHMAVSKHYCRGEFASMRISIDGENATCSMEESANCKFHGTDTFSKKCCKNVLTSLGVDQNYDSSSQELNIYTNLSAFNYALAVRPNELSNNLFSNYKNSIPPDKVLAGRIRPADICVFRI